MGNSWFFPTGVDLVKLKKWMDGRRISRAPNRRHLLEVKDDLLEGIEFWKLFGVRDKYTTKYGYAIITNELLNSMVKVLGKSKTVELGSGTGYLSHLLINRGINLTTVDTCDWYSNYIREPDIKGSYRLMDFSDYDVIIMSWPNYQSNAPAQVLKRMKPRQILMYCGEGHGGCTADDEFHEILDTWKRIEHDHGLFDNGLSFRSIHDDWYLYMKPSKHAIKGPRYKLTAALNRMYWGKLNINSLGSKFTMELIDLYATKLGLDLEELSVVVSYTSSAGDMDSGSFSYKTVEQAEHVEALLNKSNISAPVIRNGRLINVKYVMGSVDNNLVFGLEVIPTLHERL